MKKISIICLIIGAVLLISGITLRLCVDNHEDTKASNEVLKFFVGEKLSPSLISRLMKGEVKIFEQTVTLDDFINMAGDDDLSNLATVLKWYAFSPLITICGSVILLLGVALLVVLKFRK